MLFVEMVCWRVDMSVNICVRVPVCVQNVCVCVYTVCVFKHVRKLSHDMGKHLLRDQFVICAAGQLGTHKYIS